MRVNLTTILKQAQADGTGVGAFNTPNLESVRAVIAAAEAANQPVIIMHAQIHESLIPLEVIGPVIQVPPAGNSRLPVRMMRIHPYRRKRLFHLHPFYLFLYCLYT